MTTSPQAPPPPPRVFETVLYAHDVEVMALTVAELHASEVSVGGEKGGKD